MTLHKEPIHTLVPIRARPARRVAAIEPFAAWSSHRGSFRGAFGWSRMRTLSACAHRNDRHEERGSKKFHGWTSMPKHARMHVSWDHVVLGSGLTWYGRGRGLRRRRHRRIARRPREQVERAVHAAKVLVVGITNVLRAVVALETFRARVTHAGRGLGARGGGRQRWRVHRHLALTASAAGCRCCTQRDRHEKRSTKVFHAGRRTCLVEKIERSTMARWPHRRSPIRSRTARAQRNASLFPLK